MVRTFSRFLFAMALVTGFTACSEGADGNESAERDPSVCTIGCGPTFTQKLTLDSDDALLRTATLSVCRNGECYESPLAPAVRPEASEAGTTVRFPAPDARASRGWIEATLWGPAPGTGIRRLDAAYFPSSSGDANDGDTFD